MGDGYGGGYGDLVMVIMGDGDIWVMVMVIW